MPNRLKLFCILVVLKGPEWVNFPRMARSPATAGFERKEDVNEAKADMPLNDVFESARERYGLAAIRAPKYQNGRL